MLLAAPLFCILPRNVRRGLDGGLIVQFLGRDRGFVIRQKDLSQRTEAKRPALTRRRDAWRMASSPRDIESSPGVPILGRRAHAA
jgi:hypothetical protein